MPLQQFVIVAYDGTDAAALDRRMAVRPAHIENVRRLKANGQFTEGGAVLDEAGKMIGSVMIVAFDSRALLDEWLAGDPYVTGKVWERIQVQPYRSAQV
jgi:hypothetical protein